MNRGSLCAVVGLLVLMGGCGSPDVDSTSVSPELKGAPGWVLKGCPCPSRDDPGPFCGVGVVSMARGVTTARSWATARAMTALRICVQSSLKDGWKERACYENECLPVPPWTAASNDFRSREPEPVPVGQILYSKLPECSGIAAVWKDETERLWVRVELDPACLEAVVGGLRQLDKNVRTLIIRNFREWIGSPQGSQE